jgi:crotonobetainyl-CoA:carnitine CoA-transferase CaiB-like acyl-CoA transferase
LVTNEERAGVSNADDGTEGGVTGKNEFVTTRCPIRINGKKFTSPKPAPSLGEQTEKIKAELSI